MGANINTVKTQVFEIIKKNQVGGYIRTSDFNNYAKLEQLTFYENAFLTTEGSQKSTDIATALKTSVNLFPDTDGLVTKPSDYMMVQSISSRIYISQTASKIVQFQIMGQSEADAAEFSDFSKPSRKYPIAVFDSDKVQILPKSTFNHVNFKYYRLPTDPIWAFTTVSSREVYDPNNSVDFDVPKEYTDTLIRGIVRRFGYSIGSEALINYK